MSSGVLVLLVVLAVGAWIGVEMARYQYILSRLRRATARALLEIEGLERAIASFYERFPRPPDGRLPLEADEYPIERGRKPAAERY
jgi:hypothetical protein